MTINRSPALTALINRIAEEDDLDFDLINIIADLISPDDAADLRLSFDICPIHHTDLDACGDDDLAACADLRA